MARSRRRAGRNRAISGGGRFVREALLQSQVRFGQQERLLSQMLQDARDEFKSARKVEKGVARGVAKAARTAKPVIRKGYEEAGLTRQESNSEAQRVLSSLSAAADPHRAALARETAGAERRSAAAQNQALQELEFRRVGAHQGRAYAVSAARAKRDADIAKIKRERAGLAGDKGAFAASTVGQLKEAQRGRKVTRRGQTLTARGRARDRRQRAADAAADRALRRELDANEGGGKKKEKLTRDEYKGRQAILAARTQFRKSGRDYKKYRRRAEKQAVPEPIYHAGYELEKQGYIGPNTKRQLREIGISVPKRWARKPNRKINRRAGRGAAGAVADIL